jgi:caffeoyl-CoA O-methyltransferase
VKHFYHPIAVFVVFVLLLDSAMAQPPGRRGPRGGPSAADLLKPPVPKDDSEKGILDAIAAMHEGPRYANVSDPDGRLLRLLAESTDAKRVVEIGTSTGESATWLAMAVRKTGGHIYTHEIDDDRAKVAQANFEKAGVDEFITIVMGDAHETVKRYADPKDELFIDLKEGEGIDILFLDADKQGYIDYLNKLVPLVRPGGLIIAHNMRYPKPDPDYINEITTNPQFETLFLLMEGAGVGVTMKKR